MILARYDFAFKSGANKKALKINTTLNKRRENEPLSYAAEFSMGFVEKFVEIMRFRKNLQPDQWYFM